MALDIPCPKCGKFPPPPCTCILPPDPLPPAPADSPPPPPKLHANLIKIRREKRGGNREVTILEGFPRGGFDLDGLARALKAACGTGGTAKQGAIELQGDHRDALVPLLLARGFRSKRAGG